jgi:hypothetical protein
MWLAGTRMEIFQWKIENVHLAIAPPVPHNDKVPAAFAA